ncbi:hypothetical protein ACONUD_07425 [Microbulbifer harenosus]|uniref:Uncharacterized protein n=1 Tax=Microbulbifer harenosus TaxID=2576840 RepID=A0ABY2UCG1_9GAMM|nr:hypothetical protein [Microbulbifer harenosus]TLM73012.1 hypothetical protein FDY93_19235 [Microbulbifer harenosus]
MLNRLLNRFFKKTRKQPENQPFKRPTITLDYDKSLAEELKSDPLYLTVYEECQKECEFYMMHGGTRGAITMDILDVVKKYKTENPEINVPLWSGIICASLFPGMFAESAGAA